MRFPATTRAFYPVLFLACIGFGFSACAELPGAGHHSYILAVRPYAFAPSLSGHVSVADIAGRSTRLDAKNDLGLGDRKVRPGGEANLRLGPNDVWLSGFSFHDSGTGTVNRSVVFGKIRVSGSTRLETDLDFSNVRAAYGVSILGLDALGPRLGPEIGVDFDHVKLSVLAHNAAGNASETLDESFPLPFVGAHAELPLGDFLFSADLSGSRVPYHRFDGWYMDLDTRLYWRPSRNLGLYAGYRYLHFDGNGTDSQGRDYDLKLSLSGPIVGLEVKF